MITFFIIWAVCIILGVVLIILWRIDSDSDVVAIVGPVLAIIEILAVIINLISTFSVIKSNFPATIHRATVEYEETYNTLTTLLKSKDRDAVVLSEQVIKYNTDVKNYEANMSNPWVNWYCVPVEHDFEIINLEDYLN